MIVGRYCYVNLILLLRKITLYCISFLPCSICSSTVNKEYLHSSLYRCAFDSLCKIARLFFYFYEEKFNRQGPGNIHIRHRIGPLKSISLRMDKAVQYSIREKDFVLRNSRLAFCPVRTPTSLQALVLLRNSTVTTDPGSPIKWMARLSLRDKLLIKMQRLFLLKVR